MSGFEVLADLEFEVDGWGRETLQQEVSSEFRRVTTVVTLRGAGVEGQGEDVTYEAEDHESFPSLGLAGRWTPATFSASLEGVDLFPGGEPGYPESRDYRRWALESAALDLALRQRDSSLGRALDREYRPVRFVMSTRHDPRAWLAVDDALEFKLDPEESWTQEYMEALADTGRVRVLDLKAYYEKAAVEHSESPRLYTAVRDLFPDAIIEDASPAKPLRKILESAADRLSFDAPIHSVADVEALDSEPRYLNIKPSRFGTLERLFACLAWCEERDVTMYGGGQFELGIGREHLHTLASLFYPDSPSDVAPCDYNAPAVRVGLPRSPLRPPPEPAGLSFPPG